MIILTETQVMVTSHQLGLVVSIRNDMGDEIGVLAPFGKRVDQVDLNVKHVPAGYVAECLTPDAFAFVDLLDEMR